MMPQRVELAIPIHGVRWNRSPLRLGYSWIRADSLGNNNHSGAVCGHGVSPGTLKAHSAACGLGSRPVVIKTPYSNSAALCEQIEAALAKNTVYA